MLVKLHNWLFKTLSWRVILILLVLNLLCVACFQWRAGKLMELAVCDPGKVPDARFWYTPGEVRKYFSDISAEGRVLYANTQLSLDILYPILYVLLFCGLLVRCAPEMRTRFLIYLPLLAGLADIGENILLSYLAKGWLDSDLACRFATCMTACKWTLISITLGVVLFYAVDKYFNRE